MNKSCVISTIEEVPSRFFFIHDSYIHIRGIGYICWNWAFLFSNRSILFAISNAPTLRIRFLVFPFNFVVQSSASCVILDAPNDRTDTRTHAHTQRYKRPVKWKHDQETGRWKKALLSSPSREHIFFYVLHRTLCNRFTFMVHIQAHAICRVALVFCIHCNVSPFKNRSPCYSHLRSQQHHMTEHLRMKMIYICRYAALRVYNCRLPIANAKTETEILVHYIKIWMIWLRVVDARACVRLQTL